MIGTLYKSDLINRPLTNLINLLFISLASLLVALAIGLSLQLFGSIDRLMEAAKTPHWMQMHAGEVDEEQIQDFAEQSALIEDHQVIPFLNLDAQTVLINGSPLTGTAQDLGISLQNEAFDHLLDLELEPIRIKRGELYLPLMLLKKGGVSIGDRAHLAGQDFRVAGFINDSQMNSTLSSSKRFAVHPKDLETLIPHGQMEYLIEFRLRDPSKTGELSQSYHQAGLPAAGPTITYGLFRLVNAISDGILIAIVFLIAGLIIAISLLAVRFSLLTKLEEEYRDIGVMLAIGLPVKQVQRIYWVQSLLPALLGSLLGYLASLLFIDRLSQEVRLIGGQMEPSACWWSLLGSLLVGLLIAVFVRQLLQRFHHLSPVEALRLGTQAGGRSVRSNLISMPFSININLGLRDFWQRFKLYRTQLIILTLAVFIMVVPANLANTIKDESFSAYMGVAPSDIRIDLTRSDEAAQTLYHELLKDQATKEAVLFETRLFELTRFDGRREPLRIELGEQTRFSPAYVSGAPPVEPDEISLSSLLAEELGLTIGDKLMIASASGDKALRISGTYSDISHGGLSAKADFTDDLAPVVWSVIYLNLNDKTAVETKVSQLQALYPDSRVTSVKQFTAQIFGPTFGSIERAARISGLASLLIVFLISLLFERLLIAKDKKHHAILQAIGFSARDIRQQSTVRLGITLLFALILGTILAQTLGQTIAAMAIASFGATTFTFVINWWQTALAYPLAILGAVMLAHRIGGRHLGFDLVRLKSQ